jgi:hypothetical protein
MTPAPSPTGPIDRVPDPGASLQALIEQHLDWVPKRLYLKLYGETEDVVNKRCGPAGAWKRGVQFNRPPGGGLWISLKGVNAWASGQT